jgi:serine/threonine protein kinase
MNKGSKLGRGTYGIVYKSTDEGEEYAVKRNIINNKVSFLGSIRELDILYSLRGHPNIVELKNISYKPPFSRPMSPLRGKSNRKDDSLYFIMGLADSSFSDLVDESGYKDFAYLMLGSLLGLEYLQFRGIIHRDIKPDNILIYNGEALINDFGLSKPLTYQEYMTPQMFVPQYRAPEILIEYPPYGYKSDIWAMGCTFFEMVAKSSMVSYYKDKEQKILTDLLNRYPNDLDMKFLRESFSLSDAELEIEITEKRRKGFKHSINLSDNQIREFEEDTGCSYNDFIDLITSMLTLDPAKRYNVTKCIFHPFFNKFSDIIKERRKKYLIPSTNELHIYHCRERKWLYGLTFTIFNKRRSYDWYSNRIIFHTIDIFERYIYKIKKEGKSHSEDEIKYLFTILLYMLIKYFHILESPESYFNIININLDSKSRFMNENKLEQYIIKDILNYKIYNITAYEECDKYNILLTSRMVYRLLIKLYNNEDTISSYKPFIEDFI